MEWIFGFFVIVCMLNALLYHLFPGLWPTRQQEWIGNWANQHLKWATGYGCLFALLFPLWALWLLYTMI